MSVTRVPAKRYGVTGLRQQSHRRIRPDGDRLNRMMVIYDHQRWGFRYDSPRSTVPEHYDKCSGSG